MNIRLVSTSGISEISKATIAVGGVTQVGITHGVVTQSTGSPVLLSSDGLSVSGGFKLAAHVLAAATLTLDIELRPTQGGPTAKERWIITLN